MNFSFGNSSNGPRNSTASLADYRLHLHGQKLASGRSRGIPAPFRGAAPVRERCRGMFCPSVHRPDRRCAEFSFVASLQVTMFCLFRVPAESVQAVFCLFRVCVEFVCLGSACFLCLGEGVRGERGCFAPSPWDFGLFTQYGFV